MQLTKEMLIQANMLVGIGGFILLSGLSMLFMEYREMNSFKFLFSLKIMLPNIIRIAIGAIILYCFIIFIFDKLFV